ncbi:hypothetical protein PILCRDRAFT_220356 [Piloderma croceum F 1598]|uniref:Uncharacterized protein n=1 Tax=Piloderma croceum (strain F 1598) TaxID=765440 RepID=A0A0C3GF81_PILCF|nr:hypothetical protein PILCRDRAFT_220356 [Piloderma croceum F 1598]
MRALQRLPSDYLAFPRAFHRTIYAEASGKRCRFRRGRHHDHQSLRRVKSRRLNVGAQAPRASPPFPSLLYLVFYKRNSKRYFRGVLPCHLLNNNQSSSSSRWCTLAVNNQSCKGTSMTLELHRV